MKLLTLAVALLLSAAAFADTPILSTAAHADARNNFDGWLGCRVTPGAANLVVSAVGFIRLFDDVTPTASQVRIVKVSDKSVVSGSSAFVTRVRASAPGDQTYDFVTLAAPITLTAGTSYYLVGQQASGGNHFADASTVTPASDLTVDQAVYTSDSVTYNEFGGANQCMGVVNMLYSLAGAPAPPTVSMTAPANGSTIGGGAVTVSATATPAAGKTITSVQFKLDGVNSGSADTTAPYSISLNTIPLTAGTHTLTALALQSDAGTALATLATVTVANPPTVSITAPSDGATVSGTTTLTATATAAAGRTIASVQFKVDFGNYGAADTTAPYSISSDTTMLANSTHIVQAVATDSVGEVATSAFITVTVNNVAPTVTVVNNRDELLKGVHDCSTNCTLILPTTGAAPTGGCKTGSVDHAVASSGPAVSYTCVAGAWVADKAMTASALATPGTPCTFPQFALGTDVSGNAICGTPAGGSGGSGATQTAQLLDLALPGRTPTVLTFSGVCLPGQVCNIDVGGIITAIAGGPYTCTLTGSSSGQVCAYVSNTGVLTVGVATTLGSTVTCSTGVTVVPGVDSCPIDAKKFWTWNAVTGNWATSGTPLAAAFSFKPSSLGGAGIQVIPGPRDTVQIDTGSVQRMFPCVGGPASQLPAGATYLNVCYDPTVTTPTKWLCANAAGCTAAGDWKSF